MLTNSNPTPRSFAQNIKTFLPCQQLYYAVLCCLNKAVVGFQMEVGHAN